MKPYIVGLSGSPGKNSFTSSAIKYALNGAAFCGADIELLQLSDYKLPVAGSEPESEFPEDIIRINRELKKADGIIIGTPEHHNSISGMLKNAIDILGRTPFENKVVGFVGIAGGDISAVNSLNNLTAIFRGFHCWISPYSVSVGNSAIHFDQQMNLQNKKVHTRLFKLGYTTAYFASKIQRINLDSVINTAGRINHRFYNDHIKNISDGSNYFRKKKSKQEPEIAYSGTLE